MKRKILSILFALVLILVLAVTPVMAAKGGGGGINNPPGNPLWVIIEVTWDGSSSGNWTVWGPTWAPIVGVQNGGVILTSCTNCLDMSNYIFTFHGKTVHFDETYVSTVDASPQVHHVVLHDIDGNLTYTGSDPASKYTFPDRPRELYHDRIDYEISFDSDGNVTNFRYLEYEHRKM